MKNRGLKMKKGNEHLILAYTMDCIVEGNLMNQVNSDYQAMVHGNAKIVVDEGHQAIELTGDSNSYLQLPPTVLESCDELTIMCWIKPSTIKMWQRLFDFGPKIDQNIFFTILGSGDTPLLSLHNGRLERFGLKTTLAKGKWQHIAITISGNQAAILVNGHMVASSQTITIKPNSFACEDAMNYIGKSRHEDPLFEGLLSDFRLYNIALKPEEILAALVEGQSAKIGATLLLDQLTLADTSLVTEDIVLPTFDIEGVELSWISSDVTVVTESGKVRRPKDADQVVSLTAIIKMEDIEVSKTFEVNVVKENEAPHQLVVDVKSKGVDIPKTFVGLFFEDINYAADGGLYAELINNRSFEFGTWHGTYSPFSDYFYAWSVVGDIEGILTHSLGKEAPIHENNPSYLRVHIESPGVGVGIANEGFEGIAIKAGEDYRFSMFVRDIDYASDIAVCLENRMGQVLAKKTVKANQLTREWSKVELTLIPNETEDFARLSLMFHREGNLELDMVSLFPADTFNGRENGLRKDLAQMLKDINPGFIRFPGGCIVEGFYLDNAYNWKDTVGPVEHRKMNWNRWEGGQSYAYNQSYGLGFYEYFLLAEDLGAEPLPILNCGMSCQFQGAQLAEDFEPYIQDCIDLIEYANGDETTYWGQKRIEYGHAAPFNLKYLGVGNEQWVDHEKHGEMDCLAIYELFRNRIKAIYPEIQLITTSGPFPYGKEFDDAYAVIRPKIEEYIEKGEVFTEIIDEHFYMSPEWFLESMERYDHYPRYEDGKSGKIFVGEYACHTNRTGFSSQGINNLLAALSEAAFLTSAERNADVVEMTTYAPLFAKKNRTQWGPDLIWFDNTSAYGSPSYYVQKMYGNHMGTYTLASTLITRETPVKTIDYPVYTISSYSASTNEVIIKLVNLNSSQKEIKVQLDGISLVESTVKVNRLAAVNGLEDVNTFEEPTFIHDINFTFETDQPIFTYCIAPYSFDILRIKLK